MLSRAASSIYWMARYLERAENVARFVAVNEHLMLDLGISSRAAQWMPLVTTSGDHEDFAKRYNDDASEKNVIYFLTFDAENPNSILTCIRNARENARTVREVISSEMWEQINALYHAVQEHSRKRHVDNLQEFYAYIRSASHTFIGLQQNTMSHGEGWHFARLGRMLERADKTARILDVKYFLLLPAPQYVDSPYDAIEWGAVLKSANGFEMYKKHHHSIDYKNVAHFLIFEYTFPRSMAHCVHTAAKSLNSILSSLNIEVEADTEMQKLQRSMQTTNIDMVTNNGLHEFIDVFQFNLNVVDLAISNSFF